MTEPKYQPSAFPQGERWDANGELETAWQPGMTLRQWYAGQALVGAATDPAYVHAVQTGYGDDAARHLAERAYRLADAMMGAGQAQEMK